TPPHLLTSSPPHQLCLPDRSEAIIDVETTPSPPILRLTWSPPAMRVRRFATFAAVCLALVLSSQMGLQAADYSVQSLAEPAPSDGLAAEIAAQLAPAGVKVLKGTSRTVCSLWLTKSWQTKADFRPSSTVLYPFEVG